MRTLVLLVLALALRVEAASFMYAPGGDGSEIPFLTNNGSAGVASANDLQCFAMVAEHALTGATKIAVSVATPFGGGNFGVAIYTRDGTSRIATTGALSCASAGVVDNAAITSFSLTAGTAYLWCYTADNTTCKFDGKNISATELPVLNRYVPRHLIATNPGVAGAPPTTTGVLNASNVTTTSPPLGVISAE